MIIAILQARAGVPDLPDRALAPLRGQPLIWRQVERIRMARSVDRVIVATSTRPVDDPLATVLISRGQAVFRDDSEHRFMRCVEAAGGAEIVVRLKADSPFIDPALIDEAVATARSTRAAYVSNILEPTYPKGLEVEAASAHALGRAASGMDAEAAAESSPMRWLRTRPAPFPQETIRAPRNWSEMDWRVRTPADLAFARGVYDAMHDADPGFGVQTVLALLGGRQDLARWAA
ncbi:MAG: NTP transferase domain-containing protein [Phenylobacterium sp.]|uniref:cytidylyltransferase domain-containing protein n=1 Tax=Phenylobacterium sp. TaxID=1871053 RepID=UPI002735BEC6|nr:NTP transferase domain-containing protein [Phenylobacterium sp.]MDP3174047.1 NTP transferase domain-containing protein [Phenylobacterium sp.]